MNRLHSEVSFVGRGLEREISHSLELEEQNKLGMILKRIRNMSKIRRCFVAGGYASFVMGLTNTYEDVNVFVEGPIVPTEELLKDVFDNNGMIIRQLRPYENSKFYHYYIWTPAEENVSYNFIFVLKEKKYKMLFEEFIVSVLDGFDLDICKRAFYLQQDVFMVIKYGLTRPLTVDYHNTSESFRDRIKKFKDRVSAGSIVLTPHSLRLSALLALKSYSLNTLLNS